MNTNSTVYTIKHTSVNGKKQNYVRIIANGKDVLINIGEKTLNKLTEILKTQPIVYEIPTLKMD